MPSDDPNRSKLLTPRPQSIGASPPIRATQRQGQGGQTDEPWESQYLPQSNLLLAGLDVSVMMSGSTNASLLSQEDDEQEHHQGGESFVVPPRPRRLWKVHDTKLPLYPSHLYPPPNRQSSCYVTDAPPSVIAVRIAECLRRRSCVVEYDEETCTATAVTLDRCSFMVRLWRLKNSVNGVLVECSHNHSRGPVGTYHWTVKAVLQAAQSLDTGDDTRSWRHGRPGDIPRLESSSLQKGRFPLLARTATPATSQQQEQVILQEMDQVWQLLRKDRLGAQSLGMESLVALSDWHGVGVDFAVTTAKILLGVGGKHEAARQIQERWMYHLLVCRLLPSEQDERAASGPNTPMSMDDDHVCRLRFMALNTLTNALKLLSEQKPSLLGAILEHPDNQWKSPDLIATLTEDLQGVNRPPTVVQGTRLASAHEAVLCMQCLAILGRHSNTALGKIRSNEATFALLDAARTVGRSTHQLLFEHANRVYAQLTEEDRSC